MLPANPVRNDLQLRLAEIGRKINDAQRLIRQQRDTVQQIRRRRGDTQQAEALLTTLQDVLKSYVETQTVLFVAVMSQAPSTRPHKPRRGAKPRDHTVGLLGQLARLEQVIVKGETALRSQIEIAGRVQGEATSRVAHDLLATFEQSQAIQLAMRDRVKAELGGQEADEKQTLGRRKVKRDRQEA